MGLDELAVAVGALELQVENMVKLPVWASEAARAMAENAAEAAAELAAAKGLEELAAAAAAAAASRQEEAGQGSGGFRFVALKGNKVSRGKIFSINIMYFKTTCLCEPTQHRQ